MHQSEGGNLAGRAGSSHTLRSGQPNRETREEEACQLPKQVHASEAAKSYGVTHDDDEKRSYKSTDNGRRLSKNMKDLVGAQPEYARGEGRGVALTSFTSQGMKASEDVKSAAELAQRYDNRLSTANNVIQCTENENNAATTRNENNMNPASDANELSLDRQISRKDMNVDQRKATSTVNQSIEGSHFCNTSVRRDVEDPGNALRSRTGSLSRSNPRSGEYCRSGREAKEYADVRPPSPRGSQIKGKDDEMTERIRLMGEKFITQPEILQNQPHKQLERAMKDEPSRGRTREVPKTQIGIHPQQLTQSNDTSMERAGDGDWRLSRKRLHDFSRDSAGREDPAKINVFDGSFGRKKREEGDSELDKRFRYRIEAPALLKEGTQGAYEKRLGQEVSHYSSDLFGRKFGSNGLLGKSDLTTRLNQERTAGIGAGLGVPLKDRSTNPLRPKSFDIYAKRDSKSIPRSGQANDQVEPIKIEDHKFSDLVSSDQRRTMSTSPYGQRNGISFKSSEQEDYRKKYLTDKYIEMGKGGDQANRYRSPLDDLYKKHTGQTGADKKDEPVDEQFKQCQELLQRAKDRRLKLQVAQGKEQTLPPRSSFQDSQRPSLEADAYKSPAETIEAPDVKALQTRYEYLMDTIKEKESEGTRTEQSEGEDTKKKNQNGSQAKTMKWKKGEKQPTSTSVDASRFSQYNARPLRVPKPPQSANQQSNISATYDWLMKKHDGAHISELQDASRQVRPLADNQNSNNISHVVSFGHIETSANEALTNPGFMGSRTHSLGKPTVLASEGGPDFLNKYRADYSAYSKDSKNSQERSFYKPISPEMESAKITYNRMQYMPPNTRASQERQPAAKSLERDTFGNQPGNDYQLKVFGTQPQSQRKFQIERRTHDFLPSAYESAFPTKPLDQAWITKPQESMPSTIFEKDKILQKQSSLDIYAGNALSSSNIQPVAQIGKIIRQGPKVSIDTGKNTINSASDREYNLKIQTNTNDVTQNQAMDTKYLQSSLQHNKSVEGSVSANVPNIDTASVPQSSVSHQISKYIQLSDVNAKPISPSVTTPKETLQVNNNSSTSIQYTQGQSIFQRLDSDQGKMLAATNSLADPQSVFKTVYYTKFQPSMQFKTHNPEFISELVSQMEHITDLYSTLAMNNANKKTIEMNESRNKDDHTPLSSLEFSNNIINSGNAADQNLEQIGQHLSEQYDTSSKDPNAWVPQLYADMCKARELAAENEANFKKEQDKNDELIKQIEILERDLLSFRRDLNERLDGNDQSQQNFSNNEEIERQLKAQQEVEFEWMERMNALISSQKFYKDSDEPKELEYDPETDDPSKVFSNLLNKLEVLLCHQELEKSKQKKMMATTVMQMDQRITAITEKFSKIQKKIVETCSIDGDNDESQTSNRGDNSVSSYPSEMTSNNDCPTMRGTIDMLKKIRKDRNEQEKIIEQLKQIIQIQDRMYKCDVDKLDVGFKEHVQKNIDNFVNQEQKKAPRQMQLGWVAEVSEMSISQDNLDSSINNRAPMNPKMQQQDSMTTPRGDGNSKNLESEISNDQDQIVKKPECSTTEVQTEALFECKPQQSTKVYKEINTQTDEVPKEEPAEKGKAETVANDSQVDAKSTTTTERRAQQLNNFSADLQQNMNELLSEQLSKHLQQNMNEIASMKLENGRLIEKYKYEQKQVAKLKDEVKRKQKYEHFFEKQRQRKYRNCGCQVGQPQLKSINESSFASSFYHQKSVSAASNAIPPRRFNKENKPKDLDKFDVGHIVLRQALKSPAPSFSLKSPGHDVNSNTEITSMNTQFMQQKYGVHEDSTDEKKVDLTTTNPRNESQIQKLSEPPSQTISHADGSPMRIDTQGQQTEKDVNGNGDLSASERQLLQYHIMRNQELHEMLRTYLTKFEGGQTTQQDTQAILAQLNPPNSTIEESSINQRFKETVTTNQDGERIPTSNMEDSADFGLKNPLKTNERRSSQHESRNQDSPGKLERDGKNCDFIDQYFNYKNSQKKEMFMGQQNMRRHGDGNLMAAYQQSFGGDQVGIQGVLGAVYRSSSGQRAQNISSKEQILTKGDDQSRSEKRSKKTTTDGDEHAMRQDDNISENIDVSEQIKQIEERQINMVEKIEQI